MLAGAPPALSALVGKGEDTLLPSDVTNDAPVSQRLSRHHPVIGSQYDPGARCILRRPDGGTYPVVVNAAGIRSDREYTLVKPPGVYRILVFGDSQAGGWFQPNQRRFSELIEQRNPGIEVINLSLPATGTDQQLLIFEEIGRHYEHDLVILLPFLANIHRNLVSRTPTPCPPDGRVVFTAKPRFVLSTRPDGTEELQLRNISTEEEPPAQQVPGIKPVRRSTYGWWVLVKKYIYPLLGRIGFDPFPLLGSLGYEMHPAYETADTEEWRLMAAIIGRFARVTEPKPFVLAPITNSSYMRFRVGRSYWDRFSSLDDGERLHVIDLLPHFLKLGRRAIDCYLEPLDNHLSDLGHAVLADAIEAELGRLQLLPVRSTEPRAAD